MGLVAAGASGFGAMVLLFGMQQTQLKEPVVKEKRPPFDFRLLHDVPALKKLFVLAGVAWFALACLEGTFGRLVAAMYTFPLDVWGMTFTKPQGASGLVFGLESLVAFLVQGVLYTWIVRRVSAHYLLTAGFLLQGIGFLLTPGAPNFGMLIIWSALFSFGGALANPTINSECSRIVPESRQGELFGLLQSARSIGFLIGPILGGALFDWHRASPYILAGTVVCLAAFLVERGKTQAARS